MTLSRPAILLLCLISGFLPLITDGFLAAVRPLMSDFGVPLAAAQGTISVVLLGSAAAQFFVGALADRYGRRPVLTLAIVLFLGASVGLGLANSLTAVLVFRFLQGATAAAGPILARAIVRDVYEGSTGAHVLSVLATGLALIPLCVPSLNAVTVAQYGWRATAVLYVVVLVIALWMTRRFLPETLKTTHAAPLTVASVVGAARAALSQRRVLGYLLLCVSGYAGLAVWVSASPHLLHGWFGVPPMQFGVYWTFGIVAYFAGGWASVGLLRRMPPDRILRYGSLILLTAAALLLASWRLAPHELALFLGGVCLYMFGWSMLQPNAQSGALAPFQHSAGRVSALLGFLQLSGGAAVSQLFGLLHDGSPRAAVLLIVAAAVLHSIVRAVCCPVSESVRPEVPHESSTV
jgi:DHA1 family bicyclomycin/chloramphenicol resistance-like MFS transporter